MRPAGAADVVKTTAATQVSSRSGDGLAIHRQSPMSAKMFDPAVLPPSVYHATKEMKCEGVIMNGMEPSPRLSL